MHNMSMRVRYTLWYFDGVLLYMMYPTGNTHAQKHTHLDIYAYVYTERCRERACMCVRQGDQKKSLNTYWRLMNSIYGEREVEQARVCERETSKCARKSAYFFSMYRTVEGVRAQGNSSKRCSVL